MDKSWITMPQNSLDYEQGIREFINFAFERSSVGGKIICPCSLCRFKDWQTKDVVYDHLLYKKFPEGYTFWFYHGELIIGESSGVSTSNPHNVVQDVVVDEDPIQNMINDAFGVVANEDSVEGEGVAPDATQEAQEYHELARDGAIPLYEGCTKYSRLSFMVKLYHIKCLCKMSDKAMTMILELLHDAFEHAKIPDSFYEAKKTISKLGLNYQKIPVCPNNCMLYWGEDENRETCKVCNMSKWKSRTKNGEIDASEDCNSRKKIPAKVLRYFPLKPRLQRLFLSSKTAESMRWHATQSNKDGLIRHPRDGEAWKKFDSTNTLFASDPRNVRLGLATDGFNPFGSLSVSYSIWPVILIPYNTPPWMCMKPTSFILSMIIPGKRMPGNDIDIFLQPLIKELKELWHDGVDTYDAYTQEIFKLRAALMWTISDFPGLGTLSRWNTYTGLACPTCNFDFIPCRLPHSKKWCFMGHRRFLDRRHRFRLNRVRFNGEQEIRNPPKILSGSEILKQVENINVTFGRRIEVGGRRKRTRNGGSATRGSTQQWKKKSIFFELPYWEYNLLRHNLDPMHIEKNVCENVIYTLLNDSKTKDHIHARKDLQAMGIKRDLWPDENENFPEAIYTLDKKGKKAFLTTLKNITVPDGYSSNISNSIDIDNLKLNGMLKSHDCHILMEQLLPLAMRVGLPDEVSAVLIELCSFFRQLCGKALSIQQLDNLQHQIELTLCNMEILFPHSFFTVMVHLPVHLVQEVKLGGPVHYRWMYFIERFLGHMKSFVRNRSRTEGSIAEGYLMEEILTFCSRYLDNIETRWNRPGRVNDAPNGIQLNSRVADLFPLVGKPASGSEYFRLNSIEKLQAHRHVLTNCSAVDRYLQEFRDIVRRQLRSRTRSNSEIDKKVHREFVGWFSNRIVSDLDNLSESDKTILLCLAQGPVDQARRFTAYNVNGYKFRILARDKGLKTQNSGVFGSFGTRSYSSNNDSQMRFGGVPYYGMPKRKRYAPRIQAMPTQSQVNGSSSHQANTSSQSNTQSASSNHSEGQSISQTQDQSQNPPPTTRRKSTKYWTVNVIDEEGAVKESRLKVQDVFVLPAGNKIILEWSHDHQPVEDSGGLLGGFLGSIASNFSNFPIGFESWPKVPNTYKEHIWNNTIKQKFQVNDDRDKDYIISNLGRKWSNNRCELYNAYHDSTLSLDTNIDSPPDGISRDQWALFLNYREKEETKRRCDQNRANRAKQDTTHTLGSMSIARTKWIEEKKLGRPVSRGEMYGISHKRKNGSFVNDVARQKNDLLNAQPGGPSSEDAYINVFGKEHPGRVRGMGFGVCPSQFFRPTTSSGRSTMSSSSGAPSNAEWQAMKLELQESKSKVKVLEEQIAFLYQLAGKQWPGATNSAVNQAADVGSPPVGEPSTASHNGEA